MVSSNPGCPGGNTGFVSANPVNGVAPFEFLWSTGSTTQTIGNLPVGTYFVTITDAAGCITQSAQTLTSVDEIEVIQSVTPASGNNIADGRVELQVSGGTPPFRADWSNGDTGLTLNGLLPGAYTVILYDANNCVENIQIVVPAESDNCLGFTDVLWLSLIHI